MKLFSINKNEIAVLITIVTVLFLGAGYFFIYIPANEKTVQEQRFRSLQNMDRNIQAKIQNSVSLLNNLLSAYTNADPNHEGNEYLEKYIAAYSKENFILTSPVKTKLPAGKLHDSIMSLDSTFSLEVDNVSRNIKIDFRKIVYRSGDTVLHQIGMEYTFQQFIQFLLPQNVFDEYIVFSNQEVVYQTFPSGISYIKQDSALLIRNGIAGTGIKNLNVSGKDYKMFLQPINFIAGKTWVVGGLLSNRRYQLEKNQLPGRVVLLLVTVVLIIIVAFPWIKLYQMGNKDRLTISDGIAAISASMLLMSLLSFTFFRYSQYFIYKEATSSSKDNLADQVINAFTSEVDSVYNVLDSLDRFRKNNVLLHQDFDIVNLGKKNISPRLHSQLTATGVYQFSSQDSSFNSSLRKVNDVVSKQAIRQVYWLSENGTEVVNWTNDSMNAPHGNFKNRDYFKKIIAGKEYHLKDNGDKKFYLDQIVSWSSGRFTSILSMQSRDTVNGKKVAVISFTLRSLKNPVLPTGYQFALVNAQGKVLYHSDETRNLIENLVDEFSEQKRLVGCLEGKSEGVFKTEYFSTEYNIKVKPLRNLPYFIVIFGDTQHKETRDIEIYSFTLSMMLFLFGFLILQLFAIFLVSSKKSFFKKQLFNSNWVGPKISSHHQYNLAVLNNISVIILLIVFFHITSFLTYLFILLFSVTFIAVFLNAVLAKRYRKMHSPDAKFKVVALKWLLLLIFVINLAAFYNLHWTNILWFLFYQILSVAIGAVYFYYGDQILTTTRKVTWSYLVSKWKYKRSFTLMALTRLIITSGIPVMFFYISSYNYEQNISIRYNHLQYTNTLLEKFSANQVAAINSNDRIYQGYYYDGEWITKLTTVTEVPKAVYNNEDKLSLKILGLFRLLITNKAIKENNFYNPGSGDGSFYHNHLLKNACLKDSGTTTYRETGISGRYLRLTSSGLNYDLPSLLTTSNFLNAVLYWGLQMMFLIVFYFLIYNIIHKLFALNLPDLEVWKGLDDKILTNNSLNNLLFVIGLPGSGKLSIILDKITSKEIIFDEKDSFIYDKRNPANNNVFIADLINIPDSGDSREDDVEWKAFVEKVFDEKNRLIIVNHFEYNIQDATTNRIKLNLLEKVMLQNKSKLIILSTIHPVAFLDSIIYNAVNPEDKSFPGQDLERWHVLLGHYRIVIYPIANSVIPEDASLWELPIYNETRSSHFLKGLQKSALDLAKTLPEPQRISKADELAYKLQVTSHYFYMYIWQSLTKEEKFLLYDLAEDNLVNSFDDYNLSMLVAKGIIIHPDGTLKLFNKGFRNFILTAIGNSEAMKIKNHIEDNGNWGKLKNPLLIVILAILTFLLASQEETYSQLLTYITALGAGIPTIIKLFSVFDKNASKGGS